MCQFAEEENILMARSHKFWKWRNKREVESGTREDVKYQNGAKSGVRILYGGKCQGRDAEKLNLQLTFFSAPFLSPS